jgi:hypothetical protein
LTSIKIHDAISKGNEPKGFRREKHEKAIQNHNMHHDDWNGVRKKWRTGNHKFSNASELGINTSPGRQDEYPSD